MTGKFWTKRVNFAKTNMNSKWTSKKMMKLLSTSKGRRSYLLEVIDIVSLIDAASVGSLYRNMLVLPRTTTQPWFNRVGWLINDALTEQSAPDFGMSVAPPSLSSMMQLLRAMHGPLRMMSGWGPGTSSSSLPIVVFPSFKWYKVIPVLKTSSSIPT